MTTVHRVATVCLAFAAVVASVQDVLAAPEHFGQVTFRSLPVPGATVTASSGDTQVITTTDQQGFFKLPDVANGIWTIRIEMLGFETAERRVVIASRLAGAETSELGLHSYELKLKHFDEISGGLPSRVVDPARPAAGLLTGAGFRRADVIASLTAPAPRAAHGTATPQAADRAAAVRVSPDDRALLNGSASN